MRRQSRAAHYLQRFSGVSHDEPSLGRINDAFHDAYAEAEKAAESDAPVFVLFADVLVVHHAGKSTELQVTPTRFHALKCAVHAPVAAYALLARVDPRHSGHQHVTAHSASR